MRQCAVTRRSIRTDDMIPVPALSALSPRIGEWRLILWGGSFLPDPEERVDAGPVRFAWIEDGAVLPMRQGGDQNGPPAARMLIGRDQDAYLYTVLYSDARGST